MENTKINTKQAKRAQIVLLVSLIYNFVWSIAKIVFGVVMSAYFFCVSGASTMLFGFIKQIYLKTNSADEDEKRGKSITIAILLIVSSALFSFYMARLFFLDESSNYGTILSIAIATFSFFELGMSISNFIKARKANDILLQTFRACNLASSCFAISLTQLALLSATHTPANFFNALTGVVFGAFAICIGVFMLVKAAKIGKAASKSDA